MSSGRVLVTRATEDAAELLAALARRGFVGVSLPLLEYAIGPDEPIMPSEGWLLLTSPRAAQRLPEVRRHPSTRIAAIGERTASVVRERGYEVSRVAADSARSLADLLKEESGPFTWWCGDRALPDLALSLRKRGQVLKTMCVYRTMLRSVLRSDWETATRDLTAMIFASPSAVTAFVEQADPAWLQDAQVGLLVVAAGGSTEAELLRRGFRGVARASSPRPDDLAQAVVDGLGRPLC